MRSLNWLGVSLLSIPVIAQLKKSHLVLWFFRPRGIHWYPDVLFVLVSCQKPVSCSLDVDIIFLQMLHNPLVGVRIADTYLKPFNTICVAVVIAPVGRIILIVSALLWIIKHSTNLVLRKGLGCTVKWWRIPRPLLTYSAPRLTHYLYPPDAATSVPQPDVPRTPSHLITSAHDCWPLAFRHVATSPRGSSLWMPTQV